MPKALPQSPREAGGAEGVGDGRVAVADQERCLEGERHLLDDAAGAGLDRLDVAGISSRSEVDVGVELGFGAGAFDHLGEEGVDGGGALDHRAQDVEALDVARALPDRGERGLPVEARHS